MKRFFPLALAGLALAIAIAATPESADACGHCEPGILGHSFNPYEEDDTHQCFGAGGNLSQSVSNRIRHNWHFDRLCFGLWHFAQLVQFGLFLGHLVLGLAQLILHSGGLVGQHQPGHQKHSRFWNTPHLVGQNRGFLLKLVDGLGCLGSDAGSRSLFDFGDPGILRIDFA